MRHIRTDFVGAVHHVYARGNNKQAIFRDDEDRLFFLGRLRQLKRELSFRLYALALMTTHFHLQPETGPVPLKTIMSRLLTPYAIRYNKKYGVVGHLFEHRYGAKLCSRDGYFIRLVRYIHRNPVKAGIVPQPADWKWSGHAELMGAPPDLIDRDYPLSFFGRTEAESRAAYLAYVSDGVEDAWEPELNDEGLADVAAMPLADLLESIAAAYSTSAGELVSAKRSRTLAEARRQVALQGIEAGHTQAAIARALRCTEAAVSYLRKTAT